MKIWQKSTSKGTNAIIEKFTIGKDKELDIFLAPYDVLGSLAHVKMLEKVGLLNSEELEKLTFALKKIYDKIITENSFVIDKGIEDVHSQIEYELINSLGDIGKRIHSGRSRNDQVLVDLKMYMRDKVEQITQTSYTLFKLLIQKSNQHKEDLLPGYTHLQIAMPSSFGLWFGAYAESLIDDLEVLKGAYKVINKNPLGSGAGYGSSFPLDRVYTTNLLGFEALNVNVVYAQMTRGKSESILLGAISNLASTLSKLSMDITIYTSQNFGFLKLPEEFTTGSSIMPHKKNPDVAEILRAKTNRLKTSQNQVNSILSNLPSGYHRDLQLTKEILIPAIEEMVECLEISILMIENIMVNKDLLEDKKYDLLFSVENVNDLVVKGKSFREAYQEVGDQVNQNKFTPLRSLNHTLLGSIGNLGNTEITEQMEALVDSFNFSKVENAYKDLLK